MAYFSNGTEFMAWYSDNCNTCIHAGEDGSCVIQAVHMAYQGKNEECQELLDMLIPRKGVFQNERCPMFHDPNEWPVPKEQMAMDIQL